MVGKTGPLKWASWKWVSEAGQFPLPPHQPQLGSFGIQAMHTHCFWQEKCLSHPSEYGGKVYTTSTFSSFPSLLPPFFFLITPPLFISPSSSLTPPFSFLICFLPPWSEGVILSNQSISWVSYLTNLQPIHSRLQYSLIYTLACQLWVLWLIVTEPRKQKLGVLWNWNKCSNRIEHFHNKASFSNLVIAVVNLPISLPLMLYTEFLSQISYQQTDFQCNLVGTYTSLKVQSQLLIIEVMCPGEAIRAWPCYWQQHSHLPAGDSLHEWAP